MAGLYHNWKLGSKNLTISKRPETLLLRSILVVFERSKDIKNKDRDLKAKIYHMA